MKSARAAFLDKDGTLLENVPFNVDPGRMRFLPDVPEGLGLLHQAGYLLVVVSNQAGVAQNRFREKDLDRVVVRMREMFAELDLPLAGFYYCPHDPQGIVPGYSAICECRKPRPGMLLRAAADLDVDLRHSWLIGDILDDIEAGNRAGCRTILVDSGGESEWHFSTLRTPISIVAEFEAAARVVLRAANAAMESVNFEGAAR